MCGGGCVCARSLSVKTASQVSKRNPRSNMLRPLTIKNSGAFPPRVQQLSTLSETEGKVFRATSLPPVGLIGSKKASSLQSFLSVDKMHDFFFSFRDRIFWRVDSSPSALYNSCCTSQFPFVPCSIALQVV